MDVYSEVIVSRKLARDPQGVQKKLLIAASVFLLLGIIVSFWLLITDAILWILYFISRRVLEVDYEYVHVNDEMDIDIVMGGIARRKVTSFPLSQVELIAYWGAPELEDYDYIKAMDVSARDWRDRPYVMICVVKDKKRKLYLQLNDEMLRTLKTRIPSKMILKPNE